MTTVNVDTTKNKNTDSSATNWIVALLLVTVLLVGGYYRFVGLNWDDFTHLHPDERFLTQVLAGLGSDLNLGNDPTASQRLQECVQRYPNDNGRGLYFNGGYFDSQCSALNPNNIGFGLYVYGTLPLFIADVASDRFADAQYAHDNWQATQNGTEAPPTWEYDIWRGYNGAHLVWRALNGMSDLLAAFFLFLVGRRLHGKWVGLFSAALYIAAPLPIQKAHFATVNSMANLFGVLSLYYAVRVLDGGHWGDYFGFGMAYAAALASRINLVPLVILILLAAGVRMLPLFGQRLPSKEGQRIFGREFGGLVLAGFVTIIAFRIFQPYAFYGPGIFPINFSVLADELFVQNEIHSLGLLNPGWLEDIQQAQYLVGGEAESPPNWQWVNRAGYVFPLTNMVLWGMGVALGVSAWLGWVWAGAQLVRGRVGALRNLLPFAWILVYFAWIGNLWVMSMRYYLPLYPALALLGAWALFELWQRARTVEHSMAVPLRWSAAGLLVLVLSFTHIWALMFTNIYRNQLTRVQASHWVWENVPGDFAMTVDGAPADTPIVNIAMFNRLGTEDALEEQVSVLEPATNFRTTFTAPADGTISTVQIPHLGAVLPSAGEMTLRITMANADGTQVLSEGSITGNFTRDEHPVGVSYDVPLEAPVTVTADETYTFQAQAEGGVFYVSGAIVSHEGSWDDPVPTIVCSYPEGITLASDPPPGLKTARDCNSINAYSSLVNGYGLSIALDDIELKREHMKLVLGNTDYIVVSSNRFYDSVSRNPQRWPMTMAYYDALFNGELDFELVATFQETFELGPLRVPDQHLPTMESPAWLNEFEAEEAFHVYDHPVVFIFRKTDAYDHANTVRLLDSVTLSRTEDVLVGAFNDPTLIGVNPLYSLPADETPTQLKLKPEDRPIQYENGTWSERFFSGSLINTQPLLTVTAWWLLIMLFGWAAFPLTFAMFPALADRGYGMAKLVGLFVVGWFAWFATALNWYLWSAGGLWLSLLLLGLPSAWLAWTHRTDLREYLQARWGSLLAIEAVTLVAFLFFLGVRLSNPDLWHNVFGGEKPMDFAYFNAVLRSTSFPPLDPWHAGGYINYYYFGFILVGSPVLMLGVVPSIAYNLIIPTVFALTGMGAFSVAFNLAAGVQTRNIQRDDWDEDPQPNRSLRASPWTAGIAALLLAVVLGNLGTMRVVTEGLARTGDYSPVESVTGYLLLRYEQENGTPPSGDVLTELLDRGENPSVWLRIRYGWSEANAMRSATQLGMARWLTGEPMNLPTNRWYWAPTRILAEPPVSSGNAITEMPYFTFLYGDLHAHMISMPMQFFIMLFLAHELFHARQTRRRTLPTVLAIGIAAATVGMLRATNTWDWPTYLLLSVAGLGFVWWVKWQSFSRPAITDMFLRIGGFLALSVWLSYPYTRWYAAIYSSASMWQGPKTPIWAYLTIHGLFIFLIFSLLMWETGRWLRSTTVSALRGRAFGLYTLLALTGLMLALSVILSFMGWNVTVLLVPLILWATLLFFRPGQPASMQFALVLAIMAMGVTLGVEYIVIDGDIGRQNTVFKFYLQGWLMFAVVGGVAIAWLMDSSFRWGWELRSWWLGLLGVLVFIAALYPLTATRARSVDRFVPEIGPVLDGMAYMQQAQHYEVTNSALGEGEVLDLVHDYNVIRWLQENIEGTPIIMEAQSEAEYRWGSRMSIYTGMPAVVGWNWHQRQQRTFDPMPRMVQQRVANVNAFYTTPDTRTKADILQHYAVEYVIVSTLERARYPEEGIDALYDMVDDGILEVVYEEEAGVGVVFEVNRRAAQLHALEMDDETSIARTE